jgi:Tol biopolymer transport system component
MPEGQPPQLEGPLRSELSMASGARVGVYEVVRPIGVGGMGEVYLARDLRLKRDVALKVLPDRYRLDGQRRARFEREAQLLAALNHPNIATIHGLESIADSCALVMEFVDGETVADRVSLGPLPMATVVRIARQLVDALDTAHEQGIVHRDLKPANIKVRPDGAIKVLDFGLAKALDAGDAATAVGVTTLTAVEGVVVGTPAYMSPEQARGGPVDRRTDIWAFGCVLYEMMTGRRAFDGATTSDAIAAVLTREPDWAALPPDVAAGVRRLLQRCLEKDVKHRLRDIADAREHLRDDDGTTSTGTSIAAPAVRRRRVSTWQLAGIAATVALVVALAIPATVHLREAPPPELRLQITTPPTTAPLEFALSPNGRYVVFLASVSSSDAAHRLYLRALDNPVAQPLVGTDGGRRPFWSPDSRSIGFFAEEKLFRVDIAGGPPQPLAAAAVPQGGDWNADGTIVFAPNTVSALLRVPASGGAPVAATELDAPRQKSHRMPFFLPDGRHFLFQADGDPDVSGIYLGTLDGGPPRRLTAAESAAAYLPPDRVVFVQGGALIAARLDVSRGELTGDPVTLAPSIGSASSAPLRFSVSRTGIVAYRAGQGSTERTSWFDRTGKVLRQLPWMNAPELSPDGRYVAGDRTVDGNRDVWLVDLVRGPLTRFTTHQAVDGFPVWSPDGARVAFHSQRNGTFDVWIKRSSGSVGTEELLVGTPDNEWPLDWSRDGRFLLYHRSDQNYARSDLWALPMTGNTRDAIAVANTPFEERLGQFSPDGRWIVYETNESGRREIVVQAFPASGAPVHISTNGGVAPRWSADGKEIYFVAPDGKIMAVTVAVKGREFSVGHPAALFFAGLPAQVFKVQYAVTRDGEFLVNSLMGEGSASPITLILNWKP